MSDVTQILGAIRSGDANASRRLFEAVYDELRRMAARKMNLEAKDHTLQGTALVHEVYLRLVKAGGEQGWESRGHFFTAAAEAMRRILVDHARKRQSLKRGGNLQRLELSDGDAPVRVPVEDLLALDEAIGLLAESDDQAASVAKLRLFAGLSVEEAAAVLGCSRAAAYRQWTYARAWLKTRLKS